MYRRLARAGATAGLPRLWTPVFPISSGRDVSLSRKLSMRSCPAKPTPVRPASGSPPSRGQAFDGAAEAKLIAMTCGPAPAGHAKWSLRLLEQKGVELHIVERASGNTIGRILKKTVSSRISKSGCGLMSRSAGVLSFGMGGGYRDPSSNRSRPMRAPSPWQRRSIGF